MTLSGIAGIALLFLLVAFGETINGVFRTLFLQRHVGRRAAKRASLASGLLICLLICYLSVPFLPIRSDRGLLLLGISLALFMLLFDVALGRLVLKARWSTILAELDIRQGNWLSAGLVAMALCPWLAARLPPLF